MEQKTTYQLMEPPFQCGGGRKDAAAPRGASCENVHLVLGNWELPAFFCQGFLGGFLFQPHDQGKFLFAPLNSKLRYTHAWWGTFLVKVLCPCAHFLIYPEKVSSNVTSHEKPSLTTPTHILCSRSMNHIALQLCIWFSCLLPQSLSSSRQSLYCRGHQCPAQRMC